jgi:hypothetical protein
VIQDLTLRHPLKTGQSVERELQYGRGFGALARILCRRRDARSLALCVKILAGPLAKCAGSLARLETTQVRMHYASLRGRLEGFLRYRPER